MNEQPVMDRRKVIIVTIVMAVLLLGVIVLAIVSLVGKSNKSTTSDNTTTQAVAEVSEVDDDTVAEQPEQDILPAEDAEESATATVVAVADLPSTGPLDVLPIALIAGTSVAYVSSKKFARA